MSLTQKQLNKIPKKHRDLKSQLKEIPVTHNFVASQIPISHLYFSEIINDKRLALKKRKAIYEFIQNYKLIFKHFNNAA